MNENFTGCPGAIVGLTKDGSEHMVGIHRGWQGRAAVTRLVVAAFLLSLGIGTARAESAKAAAPKPAAKAQSKEKKAPKKSTTEQGKGKKEAKPVSKTAYVPIEKPDGSLVFPMRRTQMSDRMNAGIRRWERQQAAKAAQQPAGGAATESSGGSGLRSAVTAVMRMALAQAPSYPLPLDLYDSPNYAYSKLPVASCSVSGNACMKDSDCPGYLPPIVSGINIFPGGETCTGAVKSGGIRKFVDTLAPLCPVGKSSLNGNCISVATPDTSAYAGSDYYELGLKDFTWQFHSDLPLTTQVRGYYQKNGNPAAFAGNDPGQYSYLGPIIVARSYRPVRVKLSNELPPATLAQLTDPARGKTANAPGDLFIPTDTIVEGAGTGPTGNPYSNNRATIHLHGGNTPWISDGTQHQWITPIGQTAAASGNATRGWSVSDVPDMWYDAAGVPIPSCNLQQTCGVAGATNVPGDGMMTFYWTNQQSGRLMFYHDHAYGITRLNVYAGEAAGYLLVNPPDEDALAAATVPGTIGTKFFDPASALATATGADLGHMIPLVLQDKTFVPPLAAPAGTTLEPQLAQQDPSWNPALWGGEGNLWYPHVYTPNQWPDNPDLSGTNPFGHWDYGPWFWPAQSNLVETDYTGVTRPRELFKNCYTATPGMPPSQIDPVTQQPYNTQCPTTPDVSMIPESFLDTPVINGIAYPKLTVEPAAYRFQILNAAQERNWNLSWFVAGSTDPSTGVFTAAPGGTEVAMVPAVQHGTLGNTTTASTTPPICMPGATLSTVTGLPFGPDLTGVPACWPSTWPNDNRQGGVPDPQAAGPQWIQIGSEGGLLPAPAFIPAQAVGFELNKRNIVVLNVANRGLFLGPAERADVVVDFTAYAGKTLILYNDAPAPVPAGDTRLDPYTGAPDQTLSGGPPTTLPGYGPNIRTIMQVNVQASKSTPQPAVDVGALTTAIGQRFKASQPAPIVPEKAYNALYPPPAPASPYGDSYLPIQFVTSFTFTPIETDAQGNVCNGTNCPVAVPASYPVQNKALHELFTTNFGRMNSLLGTEIPTTNWLNQTTIPFTNFDPATDFLTDGQIQIWKVTHNGVDTHTIHFHLVNLQIINRVGWDGQIRPPDANELGWKEAVRMNPLEDIYLAVRPIRQTLPWPLPDKWRPMDLTRQLGADTAFTGVDIFNQAIPQVNKFANYGWEYVWHCHLLGHEEEDMLRAEVFVTAPEAPSDLTVDAGGSLSWTENSKSSTQFRIQRATDIAFGTNLAEFTAQPALLTPDQGGAVPFNGQVPGTRITKIDPGFGTLASGTPYYYRVRAEKVLESAAVKDVQGGALSQFKASSAWSNVAQYGSALDVTVSPLSLTFPDQLVNTASTAQVVTVTAGAGAGSVGIGALLAGTNPGDYAVSACFDASVPPVAMTNLTAGQSCSYSVTFKPTASGARPATLNVKTSNPAMLTIPVSLAGNGIAPIASVAPLSLTFAAQTINTTSAAQTVTLTNTGTASMNVTGVTLTGVKAADFATTACPATLAVSAVCTISVTYTPKAGGASSASLVIATSDPVSPSVTVALAGTGVAPVIGVAPPSLAFGNQLLNTSSAQVVTITNSGQGTLLLGAMALGPTAQTDYSSTSTCPALGLAQNATCQVTVTFRPVGGTSFPSSRTATLTIPSNDPATPSVVVNLSGNAVVPVMAVNTTALTFPIQAIGTTSAAQTVTLTNSGPAGATFTGTISQTNAAEFAVTGCGTATAGVISVSLASGVSCTLSVTFKPNASGAQADTLAIASTDPTIPPIYVNLSVSLAGTGTALGVSPSPLTFTGQLVGTTSPPSAISVTNLGPTALTVNGISISGNTLGDFAQVNNCGTSLAAGATCTISVTFTPHQGGASAATLAIATSDPVNPYTVPLNGTGTAPIATPNPAALTFSAGVGTSSTPQVVTITNTGTAPLVVTGVSLGGTNANQFSQTNNCVGTWAPGTSCAVNVTFAPTGFGTSSTKTASLTVTVSAPAASPVISLVGTLIIPTYTMLPNPLQFPKQQVGTTSAPQTITVTNTGTVPLFMTMDLTNAPPDFAATTTCGTSLAVSATCTVTVVFKPTQVGNLNGAVSLRAQKPATSTNVNLLGTGY